MTENLLLSLQADGNYLAYLISYDITEDEKAQLKNNDPINLDGKVTYSLINDNYWVGNVLSRSSDCVEGWVEVVPRCPFAGKHSAEDIDNGANCAAGYVEPSYFIFSLDPCDGGGGGTSYNNPPDPPVDDYGNPCPDCNSGNGTNNGTDTSNNTEDQNGNDGTTDPNSDCLQPDANGNCVGDTTSPIINAGTKDRDDCKKLKEDITDKHVIKTRLKTLRLEGEYSEKGLRVDINPNTGEYTPSDILSENNSASHIKIPVNPYTVVIAHTHPPEDDDYFAMFSGPDIIKMGEIVKHVQSSFNPIVDPMDITHILVADGKTFALRFDDATSIQALLDIYEKKDKKRDFTDDLKDAYESDNTGYPLYQPTTTISKQQEHLYNLFSKYNLNMSLYEANYDDNGFVSDWQKINKDTLQKEPCN